MTSDAVRYTFRGMDAKAMTTDLLESGLSQHELAALVRALGVRCTQPTIHRTAHGLTAPSYRLGRAIETIWRERRLDAPAKRKAG